MSKVSPLGFALAAGVAAAGLTASSAALAAAEEDRAQAVADAVAEPINLLGTTADVELRFVQEDGPESGHVRVELTPEAQSLTIIEARAAAEQAFLAALKEPGLGDDLSRITVVVRLMPSFHPDAAANEQRFLFLHKGGREWSILSGD